MDLTDTPDDIRDTGEEPPAFDELEPPGEILRDQPTRERIHDVILQLREPTTVTEIADDAVCDTETARDYLKWFTEIGMVREHTGRPVRYDRNESYLRWRRIEAIRTSYSEAEIVEELESVLEERAAYRERFGTESPDAVSLLEESDDGEIAETWEALSEWKTIERRAALLDAARRDGAIVGGDGGRIDA